MPAAPALPAPPGAPARPPCPVIVMAKAPRPGYAKTRLAPALGADGAAALAHRLLLHALDEALGAGLGAVELCCAPDAEDPLLAPLARPGLALASQGTGDLGARMQRPLARWLPRHGQALITGTDCPALTRDVLRQAMHVLQKADAVFVPAHDGGYALIGLRGSAPARFAPLFDAMPWSTPGLMAATRTRAAQAGLQLAELPALHDIDEPADLVHLPAGWRP